MTRVLIALTVAVLSAAGVSAQSKDEEAVRAAQKRFLTAWRTCNGAELSRTVTSDFEMIHGGGRAEDKTQFLKGAAACSIAEIRFDVSRVRLYGDTAILQGMYHWKLKQGSVGSGKRMEVWVKQEGNWMFATHAATVSPSTPPPSR